MKFITTSRLVIFAGYQRVDTGTDGLSKNMERRFKELGLTPVTKGPVIVACEQPNVVNRGKQFPTLILDVLPGQPGHYQDKDLIYLDKVWTDRHTTLAESTQYYNLIDHSPGEFRIESDVLNIKPLYRAEVSGGTILASRIADMLQLFPELRAPCDVVGLYGLLLFHHPVEGRTLHARIHRSQPGTCYWCQPGLRLRLSRDRRLRIPEVVQERAPRDIAEQVISILETHLTERLKSSANQPILGLTGGFDSRVLAGVLHRMKVPVRAVTYGNSYHREVSIAKRLAKAVNLDHELYPYPENHLLAETPLFLDVVEAQCDLTIIQIANLLKVPHFDGDGLLHGFLGDCLSGGNLSKLKQSDFDSLSSLRAGITNGYRQNKTLSGEYALFESDWSEEAFLEEVQAGISCQGKPYQAAMLWDLEQRQHGFIGYHLNVLGKEFDPLTPFYNSELMLLWMSLPHHFLKNQFLLREIIRTYFPALGKIPNEAEDRAIISTMMSEFQTYLTKRYRQIAGTLVERVVPYRFRPVRKNSNIWALSYGLTAYQKKHMLGRVSELEICLEEMLGIRLSRNWRKLAVDRNWRLRHLYVLAEYASRIRSLVLRSN